MARFQSPQSGQIIDIEDDYDTATGVNKSAQKAQAKGWVKVNRLVSKSGKEIDVSDDALDKALAKGWQLGEVAAGKKQADEQFEKAERTRLDTPMGQLETGARNFAQAATFNTADELGAAFGAVTGQGDYSEIRDRNRQQDKIANDVNPKSAIGGTVAGIAPTFLAGMGTRLGAGAGKGLAQLMGEGALFGGVSGAGASEADSLEGVASDTGKAVALGAAIPAALKGSAIVGKAGFEAAKKALDPSELRAKVVSSMLKDYKGPQGAQYDKEKSKVMKAVKALEAKGFFNGPGTNTREGLFNKADNLIEELYDEAQTLLQSAGDIKIPREKLLLKLREKGVQPLVKDFESGRLSSSEASSKIDELTDIATRFGDDMSLTELQNLKRGLQKRAREMGAYKTDPSSTMKSGAAKDSATAVREALEEGVDLGNGMGLPTVDGKLGSFGQKFKAANEYQGNLLDAQEMLGDSIARDTKNMPISLTTGASMAGAGATDAAVGSGGIASMVAAAGNIARQPWARLVIAKLGDKIQDSETLKRTLAFLKPMVDTGGEVVLNSKTINAAARMAGAKVGEKD